MATPFPPSTVKLVLLGYCIYPWCVMMMNYFVLDWNELFPAYIIQSNEPPLRAVADGADDWEDTED